MSTQRQRVWPEVIIEHDVGNTFAFELIKTPYGSRKNLIVFNDRKPEEGFMDWISSLTDPQIEALIKISKDKQLWEDEQDKSICDVLEAVKHHRIESETYRIKVSKKINVSKE